MSIRTVSAILALVLVAAACGEPPIGEVDFGSGRQFLPQIADSIDDVGRGAAVAFNADGVPFVSYLGFLATLAEGEIALTRPVGAPFVPGVLLASQTEGVWNRGAVAMAQDPPARVSVPFGPATVESFAEATAESSNGSDIAIGADGTMHVVWTAPDGIWQASGSESFTAEQVVPHLPPLSRSGPLGWPSVAVDEDGTPWIAATRTTTTGQEVIVATPGQDAWEIATVAEIAPCTGCPDPARTGIAATPEGPVVVYADPTQGVMAGRLEGRRWTTEAVDAGAEGTGISVAADAEGAVTAAYYGADGSVHVASSSGGGWRASEAVTVGAPTASPSPGGTGADDAGADGRGTGVAVTDDGTVYLTYVDPAAGVVLASAADGETFEPIETRGTEAGQWPDVAVTPDGATVSVVWYAPEGEDLGFGSYAEVNGITVAAPSPPFAVGTDAGGGTGEECGPDTVDVLTDLQVVAPVGATSSGFEQTCIVAPAGEPLTLTFENLDPGIPHNAEFLTEAGGDPLFTSGDPVPGPETQGPADVEPQDEGSYYFLCLVHPDTMNGTFVVAEAARK